MLYWCPQLVSWRVAGPCPEFQCEGGFECGIEGLGGICDQLPRYCIHDDQRCNGIANCGQHDDSDERRCKHQPVLLSVMDLVEKKKRKRKEKKGRKLVFYAQSTSAVISGRLMHCYIL